MKIKQAIAENHYYHDKPANPQFLFVATMQSACLKQGTDQAMAQIFGYALAVAKELNCYFETESTDNSYKPDNDIFYFWSKSLGDNRVAVFNQAERV